MIIVYSFFLNFWHSHKKKFKNANLFHQIISGKQIIVLFKENRIITYGKKVL